MLSEDIHLTPKVGPYLGYAISGNNSVENKSISSENDTDVTLGSDQSDQFTNIDFGATLGLGLAFYHYEIYFLYDLGLIDIAPNDGVERTNNAFRLGFLIPFAL